MEDEKKEIRGIVPSESFTGEDWIRAGRRRYMLLNVIYYLQQVTGEDGGVSRRDLLEFLEALKNVDMEIYHSIVRPNIPVKLTLKELISDELVTEDQRGTLFVNKEIIKSERELIYWEDVKKVFDKINES